MDRLGELGRKNAGLEDSMSNYESFALGFSGRLQGANAKSRQAVDSLIRVPTSNGRRCSRRERRCDRPCSAVRPPLASAGAALNLSKAGEVQYGVAFALAVAGDASRSQRLATIWNAVFRKTRP